MATKIVKVTRNYQITIPKGIRTAAGIEEGDLLHITVKNGKIIVEKIESDLPVVKIGKKVSTPTREEIHKAILEGMEAKT